MTSRARVARRLLVASLPLYFAWEMLQAAAFTGVPTSWWRATALCALATLGDAAVVLGLWAVGSWVRHEPWWFDPPRRGPYLGLVLGGIAVNTLVERLAVSAGAWGYQPWHPVVPGLDVGLLALLQPIALLPLTFSLAARGSRRRRG